MKVHLRVEAFPLSWREEGEKLPSGYRKKSQCVGRRVWGADIGKALWCIEASGNELHLLDLRDGGRLQARWPRADGYDSPWAGEGPDRLRQVAEWHEAEEFNRGLELLVFEREEVRP